MIRNLAELEKQKAEKRFVLSTMTTMTAGAAVVNAIRAAGLVVAAGDPVSTAVAKLCVVAGDITKALHIPAHSEEEHVGLLELAALLHGAGIAINPETLELEDREPVVGPTTKDMLAEIAGLLESLKAAPKAA